MKLLPGGGPPGPGTQTHPSAQTLAKLLRIAECMRQHGISDFPDPMTSVPSDANPAEYQRDHRLRRSDPAVPGHVQPAGAGVPAGPGRVRRSAARLTPLIGQTPISRPTSRPGRRPLHARGMNPGQLRDHCLSFPGAEETFPFGPDTSVFKVGGKLFALSQLGADSLRSASSASRTLAEALREAHAAVSRLPPQQGHWNTVTVDGPCPTRWSAI